MGSWGGGSPPHEHVCLQVSSSIKNCFLVIHDDISLPVRPCLPADTVKMAELIDSINDTSSLGAGGKASAEGFQFSCHKECRKTEILATISSAKGNFDPLRTMLLGFGVVKPGAMGWVKTLSSQYL